jgi:competence protein ComGC
LELALACDEGGGRGCRGGYRLLQKLMLMLIILVLILVLMPVLRTGKYT